MDVNYIDKSYNSKPVSFEVTVGRRVFKRNILGDSGDGMTCSKTSGLRTIYSNKHFGYLDYREEKPCVSALVELPDFRRRMLNGNIISKIKEGLVSVTCNSILMNMLRVNKKNLVQNLFFQL